MFMRIFVLIFAILSLNLSAEPLLKLGDTPPDYLGKDTDGNEISLKDHQGKIVIISFWASWCAPCLKELPILEGIQNEVGEDKVKVVAINFKEDRKKYHKIKKLFSSLKLTLTHDKRGAIGNKFGVKAIPHLFIVGKNGELVLNNIGYGEESLNRIVKVVNQQLAG